MPTQGTIRVSPHLRLSVFTQHHLDSFNLDISPLQNLLIQFPRSTEPEVRAHLGRYEVQGNDAIKPMKFSSGGQKSRVAFAALTFNRQAFLSSQIAFFLLFY
jgi:ATP-binding cassette subfamily F protein 3